MKIKQLLLFVISFMFSTALFAQRKQNVSATDFWYKWNSEKISQLGLPNVANSENSFYWRMAYYGQVTSYIIDIYKSKNSKINGLITLFTNEHVDITKEYPTNRIYSSTTVLDSIKAIKMYEMINYKALIKYQQIR